MGQADHKGLIVSICEKFRTFIPLNMTPWYSKLGVERNRNQETGSFQELLELVISGKCMHSRYPHKTPGIKNSCKIARSCSTPTCLFTISISIHFMVVKSEAHPRGWARTCYYTRIIDSWCFIGISWIHISSFFFYCPTVRLRQWDVFV